ATAWRGGARRETPPPPRCTRPARCGRGWWPSAAILEVIEQELFQHVLLFALLFARRGRFSLPGVAAAGGRRRVALGRRRFCGCCRGLRSRCGATQSIRIREESLLHLVRALAQDDRLHVVLGAHLLERVGGLHLREQARVVLSGFHLEEADRGSERE